MKTSSPRKEARMSRLQMKTLLIAQFLGGVALVLMAIAAFNGFILLPSSGPKYGPPKFWSAWPIDSFAMQVICAVSFAGAGFLLFWMAYQNHKVN